MQRIIATVASPRLLVQSAPSSTRSNFSTHSSDSRIGASSRTPRRSPTLKRQFHSSGRALDKDPYATLGVAKDAKTSEIKKAYYKLAKKFHPDSNKEKTAKEKFVEIQNAYDTLSDDSKRAAFDRFGSASQQSGFDADAYARATSSFGGSGFGDFFNGGGQGGQQQGSDMFESLFGAFGRGGGQARQGQSQQHVGEDIEVKITLPFNEAAKGTTRTINITPVVDCKTCKGSGLKEGAKVTGCGTCGGTGTRTFTIQSGFTMASTCTACGGSGSVKPAGSECGDCTGIGKVRERSQVDIEIPAGVDHGMRVRVDGKGDAPISGPGRVGDLFARIEVLPSKNFRRQGTTLYHDVTVPFYSAILGGTARVPTLDADVDLRIPNGTQAGDELVLKGRGVQRVNRPEYGDLVVRFNVAMPRSLTAAQRRILNQYVSETEHPGSSAYAPSSPAPKSKPSPSSAGSTSPGLDSQSAPPPPRSSDTPASANWWSTLGDEVKPVDAESSTPPPPPPFAPEPEARKPETGAPAEDATMFDTLWKGAKSWLPKK